ncbi:hypothetical protein B0T14DRAFT_600779 [Immersiella caudata]|uniref:Uncharacterized protein n=1 Tax=Immersiella caudata TaxID=314043 RepID=A0AA39X6A9_9PEZI|nr:hypothetical protein B0T14DRAFT_600779 [Immersiella caudata]
MANPMVDVDTCSFTHASLAASYRLNRWQHLLGEVEDTLVARAQGMFRWVDCQIRAIERVQTYVRIFEAIDEADRQFVRLVLVWVRGHKRTPWMAEGGLRVSLLLSAVAYELYGPSQQLPFDEFLTSPLILQTRVAFFPLPVEVIEAEFATSVLRRALAADPAGKSVRWESDREAAIQERIYSHDEISSSFYLGFLPGAVSGPSVPGGHDVASEVLLNILLLPEPSLLLVPLVEGLAGGRSIQELLEASAPAPAYRPGYKPNPQMQAQKQQAQMRQQYAAQERMAAQAHAAGVRQGAQQQHRRDVAAQEQHRRDMASAQGQHRRDMAAAQDQHRRDMAYAQDQHRRDVAAQRAGAAAVAGGVVVVGAGAGYAVASGVDGEDGGDGLLQLLLISEATLAIIRHDSINPVKFVLLESQLKSLEFRSARRAENLVRRFCGNDIGSSVMVYIPRISFRDGDAAKKSAITSVVFSLTVKETVRHLKILPIRVDPSSEVFADPTEGAGETPAQV